MQQENPLTVNDTHNIFLHKVVDNQQTKSVMFMKLDSHKTLYREGVEAKYLTNLVLAGRNFIEVFAVFQKQITLSMGHWHIFEDILGVYQWDKAIVVATEKKIIGLIYEDCIFKNSFMLSLQFLQLGYREPIQVVCDRSGQYMVLASAREILFCISHKAIQKYKTDPYYHRNSVIVEEVVKWNRSESQFQNILYVIKFDLFDFELSKVDCFHFCDQELYFMGHSNKIGSEKSLFYIPISKIFSDDENQPLILNLSPQPNDKVEIYPIRRGNECQFLVFRDTNTIEVENQKGIIYIEKGMGKNMKSDHFQVHKSNTQNLFPLSLLQNDSLHIYDRLPTGSESLFSLPSHFSKRIINLPSNTHILHYDLKDNLLAYCNNSQVGLIYLNSLQPMQEEGCMKSILKESLGRIIDFNISSSSKSVLLVENYHDNLCRLQLLRQGITEDPRPFITHAKKKSLESIEGVLKIRSLSRMMDKEVEVNHFDADSPEIKNVRDVACRFCVITRFDKQAEKNVNQIFQLEDESKYTPTELSHFSYYTIIYDHYQITKNNESQWLLLLWFSQAKTLKYFQISPSLTLIKEDQNIHLIEQNWEIGGCRIQKMNEYLITVYEKQLRMHFYDLRKKRNFQIKLQLDLNVSVNGKEEGEGEGKALPEIKMSLNKKNITFKKKDKDYFILEALVLISGTSLLIYEISVDNQLFKISQRTDEIGQGLPVVFPSNTTNQFYSPQFFNHKLRAIMCPEYVLNKQNIAYYESPRIIAMHSCEYEGLSFLFMVNSKGELLVYKKIYSCGINSGALFSCPEVGFFYYRQNIPLSLLSKFKYHPNRTFIDIGCGILRISNLAFYKGSLVEIPDHIVSCFEMQGEIWSINGERRIRKMITSGSIMSHFYLANKVDCSIKTDILGLQSTNQYYIVYSRCGFEVFDKEMNLHWAPTLEGEFGVDKKEVILTVCAFDHYLAVSLYNYCQNPENPSEYQSIKFKLRLYNTITKNKIMQKDKPFEEPILFIRYFAPDKLILVTPSNLFVNLIKNDKTLESFRTKNYTKKTMLSTFSYIPEKIGGEVGLMLFGGIYGGMSLMVGKWIDQDVLNWVWFDGIKCGVRASEIFKYGHDEMYKTLVADEDGNLIIFNLGIQKAQKLVDLHLGSRVNSMKKRNQQPYIASDDGCIRVLIPIKLKDYEISLLDLQEEISEEVPFLGGLNTRNSRCLQQRERTYKITSKGNMVDGELLEDFMSLTETLRNHILQKADMTLLDLREQLLNYLLP